MARSFTQEEQQNIIEQHKAYLLILDDIKTFASECQRKLQEHATGLSGSEEFRNLIAQDITGTSDYRNHWQYRELMTLAGQYQLVMPYASLAETLKNKYAAQISDTINLVAAAPDGIRWFFTTGKKKNEIEASYEFLCTMASNEYGQTMHAMGDTLNKGKALTYADTAEHPEQYKDTVMELVPGAFNTALDDANITEVLDHHEQIARVATGMEDTLKKDEAAIGEASDRLIAENVYQALKDVSVEALNANKEGIRVKLLKDRGYNTMADLYNTNVSNLTAIKGISHAMAEDILENRNAVIADISADARLSIRTDQKTEASGALVTAITKYQKRQGLEQDAAEVAKQSEEEQIPDKIDTVKKALPGLTWIFSGEEEQKTCREAFDELKNSADGEYGQKGFDVVNRQVAIETTKTEDAWAEYEANAPAYYSTLEKVVPDRFDADYKNGLPDELAEEIDKECIFPDGLLCTLRGYQETGVKYILHQGKVLLGDEMGLGKTIQAIAAMVSLKNIGATHFMVVCPASVIENWCREIRKHSKLSVIKIHGKDKQEALAEWHKSGGVGVTTYETTGIFYGTEIPKLDLTVVDEAHFIKNKTARRTINTTYLCGKSERLIFLTGTALENRLDEMISLIQILKPDMAEEIGKKKITASAEQFRNEIATVYYRRKREDVLTELPELTQIEEWCTLCKEEKKIYERDVLNESFNDARRVSWRIDDLSKSCKATRLKEIVDEAKEDGRKIIVFSFYLDTIRKVGELLGDACCGPINGSVAPAKRQEIIDEFEQKPEGSVLLAQIQAGGTGLNIQSASVVIICEPQFKPSIENQAISRAYRMGQTRNVLVYRLLCAGTVDERMYDLMKSKQDTFDIYADMSVAAQSAMQEIDNRSFNEIIEEEIQRIKEEQSTASKDSTL